MPVTYDLLTVRGDLIPIQPPLVLDSVAGLGMPPLRHLVIENAQQDGVTYIDSKLDPRVVTFGLQAYCGCDAELWDVRQQLVALQGELSSGYKLRVATPNGHRYMCDLRYGGGLDLPHDLHLPGHVMKAGWQGVQHDNPTLYDPDQHVLVYNLGTMLGDGFPWSFPHSFGTDIFSGLTPLTYAGTWRTYPIIRITGPATDIVITNTTNDGTVTTVQTLDMTGWTLDAGEVLTIDCTPGVKTVTHSVDGNTPYWLSSDSNLGTFCILPHPAALHGYNALNVAFDDAEASTTIQISYYDRYLGI